MKKIFTLFAAASMLCAFSSNAALYIVGDATSAGWDPENAIEMTDNGDNTYSYTLKLEKEGGYFGLSEAKGDWDAFNAARLYPANGEQGISLGEDGKAEVELATTKNGGDAFTIVGSEAGQEVIITVDLDEYVMTVEVPGGVVVDPKIYLVGDVTDWGFDAAWGVESETGIYEWKNVTVAGNFKLANKGWAPNNVGAAYEVPEGGGDGVPTWPTLGTPYSALNDGGSGNLVINNDLDTEFTVDIKLDLTDTTAPVVTITEAAGIEAIDADNNAAKVYFNLQGVQVANPANGLYIVRQGSKATKVYVK